MGLSRCVCVCVCVCALCTGELQACLTAASDRIAQLEQDSEAAATAHEQQAEQLRQELTDTKVRTMLRTRSGEMVGVCACGFA